MSSRRSFLQATGALALAGMSRQRAFADRPRIKVGQIGTTHAHASKLAVFRESPDYEVVGVVEPDGEQRARAASQPAYRDLPWLTQEALLDTPGLELVLVETTVRDLLDAAEACVAVGKHVHLDKPAGESLPQYERLLAAAASKQLLVQMGYMYRYNPGFTLLREFLREGWLGDVFSVDAVMSKVIPPADRRALAEYPGGTMFELGCHLVDRVVEILGPPAQVQAFPQHAAASDDGLQDNMLAVFRYPRALATVTSSALEVDGFARRHVTVCGTGGTFHIQPLDSPSIRLTLAAPQGPYAKGVQEIALPKYRRYVDDAADIARILRGERPADFSYEHDLAVQRSLLEACGLEVGNRE